MTKHALIAPSSLELTIACAGSLQLQLSVPELPPTDDEALGTAAHWVALRYAAGYGHELPVGTKFTNGGKQWEVDNDMVVGATIYKNAMGGAHSHLRLEDAVNITRIHPEHCYGTPDAWAYYPETRFSPEALAAHPDLPKGAVKLIRVGDYKFGHRYHEVFQHPQLCAYAAGVMERLNLSDNDPDLWLELIIVQPRCFHREGPVRRWLAHASEIRGTINQAWNAGQRALQPNPETTVNKHCGDCRARHVCKTLQWASGGFVEFSGSAEAVELTPEATGIEMMLIEDAIERLDARLTGIQAQAEAMLRQGKAVPHYHLEAGQSRRIYRDDVTVEEVLGMGDLLNVDLRKKQTKKDLLVTPRQAIDLGIDEGIIAQYSFRPRAALKVTRDNPTHARKVFYK